MNVDLQETLKLRRVVLCTCSYQFLAPAASSLKKYFSSTNYTATLLGVRVERWRKEIVLSYCEQNICHPAHSLFTILSELQTQLKFIANTLK
jgi:hypothetical protein